MEKQKKVLDASVLFKIFSKEEDSFKIEEIIKEYQKGDISVIIPAFAIIEVINALRYKEKSEEKVKSANNILKDLQFKIEGNSKELMDMAIEISFKYNITIYDAVYAATAKINNAYLITADSELYKIPNVIPIAKL